MRYFYLMLDDNNIFRRGQEIVSSHLEIASTARTLRAIGATPVTQTLVIADTAVKVTGDPMDLGTTTEAPNVIVLEQNGTEWDTYHFNSDELEGGALQRSVDPDDETKPHPAGPPEDTAGPGGGA
jgi:hypothetical protein